MGNWADKGNENFLFSRNKGALKFLTGNSPANDDILTNYNDMCIGIVLAMGEYLDKHTESYGKISSQI